MRKISKLFFLVTALTFALSFGVVSNSPTAYATSGGGEGRCSDFSEASDREMCTDQYNECQAATGGNNCMERAVEYTQENGTQAPEGEPDVCTAGALGWIVCPAIDFLATMNDAAYAAVEAMLYVNPVALENGGPLFETWQRFRDIANALFVVAILVIVFSQATSLGLSSYGVKKLLPRVIAAAILVNISFFLCQIAIDISNIIGVSIHSLFESFYSDNDVDIDGISWSSLITGILAGGALWGVGAVALGSGGIMAAMASILPFLVTALFAVITALVVLIARQVIIILLVALSPLAFVAFILPNTQKYFQMWQNTITTMLVMFPLVAALFAGSKLAANIVLTSPTSDDGGGISLFSGIAAICMMFIPLFAVPFIVKFSGGTLGRLAGMVNNPNKGPFDKLRKQAEGYRDFKKDQSRIRNANGEFGKGVVGAARKKTFGAYNRRRMGIESERQSTKRFADDATSEYVAEKPLENGKFAERMAGGGQYQGDNLSTAITRVQASAVAHERDESRKRIASAQQLMSYRERGMEFDDQLSMYENEYRNAAQRGDYETMSAVLKNVNVKGSPGRAKVADMLTTHSIGGATPEIAKTAQKEVERTVYEDLSLGSRADVMKGGMDVKSGKWSLKAVSGLATEQKASLDGEVLKAAIAGGQITKEEAHRIVTTNLRDKVENAQIVQQLEKIANPPSSGGTGGGTPPPSPGPSGPAPSGGSGGSPAAPRGPSGPPPAAPLGYAPAPQATVAPTPPPAQVVQAPTQQAPAPAAPARNLPPAQQATIAPDAPRYTSPYSQSDLQAMGSGGIRTIIREVPQGAQGLSNADIAKIINATDKQDAMQDINQELRMERNRRRGGFDPTSGPKNPLP